MLKAIYVCAVAVPSIIKLDYLYIKVSCTFLSTLAKPAPIYCLKKTQIRVRNFYQVYFLLF